MTDTDADPEADPDAEGSVEAVPGTERDFEAGARGTSVDNDLLYDRGEGLFHTLEDGPIADHIAGDEHPQFVLQNRKGGLTVEQPEGTVERSPSRRYRAFCVVTDRRLLFLVGRTDGDDRTAVPYGAITNVSRSGGVLHDELRVNTGDDVYAFPIEKSVSERELDAAIAYVTDRMASTGTSASAEGEPAVERTRDLVRGARDASVTMDRLTARDGELLDLLDPGEQPHYYLTGTGHRGIEVEHADGEVLRHGQADAGLIDSLNQLDRDNRTVVTDRRVLAYLPKTTDTVEYTVPFAELVDATIEAGDDERNPRLCLSTGDRAYRLEVHAEQRDRLEAALAYIGETAGLDGSADRE